jgi:nicotinate-nucleotide adenylyltransferase
VRRLGVMGGTFDPIHTGHLRVATEVLDLFALDRILFVPAGTPWQKEGFSAAEDRWMMTALAASAEPRFEASRMEIDRKGPTYTVDTMAMLRDFYGPEAVLYFIAGIDAVLTLGTWHGAGVSPI